VTSKRNEEKARREREIFSGFAIAANLDVEADSITSETFPKLDISCVIAGHRHYFELAEVVDEGVAVSDALTQKDGSSNGGFYSSDIPLMKIFRAKAEKSYDATGGLLELLAYYDKQDFDPLLERSTTEEVGRVTNEMLRSGIWHRLWLFDSHSKKILLKEAK